MGDDLRRLPIEQRKRTLAGLLRARHSGIALNEHSLGDGDIVYRHACKLGCAGIVSRRLGSAYHSGRSKHWVRNWVEHAQAPDEITAWNGPNDTGTYSRPVCKYPDTLAYRGGPITNASSFTCTRQTTDPLISAEQALPDIGARGETEH